ncbi:dihydrofolate reductase family protein [Roseivirga sp.]|uniref:dihydrofolate reductase family protein n=1 Tax=Roseivirga sp. TaxID=1964215 RepID=UPI003B51C200
MRKLITYIAISLDGKIADRDGGVEWLESLPHPKDEDYGYATFIQSIDTTIMGNTTYQQVLGFDVPFPYQEQTNYVLTRNTDLKDDENVLFISKDHAARIEELKKEEGKDIWLIGGGQINTLCLQAGLIDEMIVHVMPYVMGAGIPLFSNEQLMQQIRLTDSKVYSSGVMELRYEVF